MSKNKPVCTPSCAPHTLTIHKRSPDDRIVALAGNPNVGKSTIFNALTGMHQHTGNWPGKTVEGAQGSCTHRGRGYALVDVPGCYSLMAHSAEEEVARDFICFGGSDAVIVVCDATCLERNLNLALQIIEAAPRVVVGVNLMDEARKKHIHIDLDALSDRLGVPVAGLTARSGRGLDALMDALDSTFAPTASSAPLVRYPDAVERAIERLLPPIQALCGESCSARWLATRLLDADPGLLAAAQSWLGFDPALFPTVETALAAARRDLAAAGLWPEQLRDTLASSVVRAAEDIAHAAVRFDRPTHDRRDRRLDRLFTSRLTGFPIMLLLLLAVFWLTITGANVPSSLLSSALFGLEEMLARGLLMLGAPQLLIDALVHGMYRVVAWVVSVMLPPMAIFFPLFTLLEDFGYLPRVAFNLDRCFKCCAACGKQALTICMGFGCNAAGVVGCRIIDSPRERLIAILTNSFVPCNGRFPTILSLITLFLLGGATGLGGSLAGAALLVGVIVLGVAMTLAMSKLLSLTLLRGQPSSFTLELPPYRRPQVCRVIVRSVVDRTLKVLGRAVVAAAPAGLLIWFLAHVSVGGVSLLGSLTGLLDPLGRALGMDGVILTAFLLGWPANEIVVPVMVMTYLSQGSLLQLEGAALGELLIANGWTWSTAVSVILFSLLHWPCATTCITIRRETGSLRWTLAAIALPTLCGMAVCLLFQLGVRLL